MSFGFQIFRIDGSLLYDGSAVGMTFKDAIVLSAGAASGSKAYPELAGFTLFHNQMSLGPHVVTQRYHTISVDYSAGYPVIYWTLTSPNCPTVVYVFAR